MLTAVLKSTARGTEVLGQSAGPSVPSISTVPNGIDSCAGTGSCQVGVAICTTVMVHCSHQLCSGAKRVDAGATEVNSAWVSVILFSETLGFGSRCFHAIQ